MNRNDGKKNFKDSIFILILALCIIAVVASVILSVVASLTKKPIEKSILNTTLEAFRRLDNDFNNDPILEVILAERTGEGKWSLIAKETQVPSLPPSSLVSIYPAKKDGKLNSFFIKATSPFGYAGDVTALAAVSLDGRILNVDVTESNETPGLGTNVYSREQKKTIWGIINGDYKNNSKKLIPNPILDFFNNKGLLLPGAVENSVNDNLIPESKWKVIKDGGDFKYITGATITSRAVTDAVKRMLEAYEENRQKILMISNSGKVTD